MSREIKFRAWLRVENDFNDKGYKMIDDLAFEEYLPVNDQLASVKHLMQYTGLKDKNGKEIYEGDIVSFEDDPADVIVWSNKDAAFIFCELSKIDKNRDKSFFDEFSKMRWDAQKHYIIQGNIYQTPELLQQHL